MMTRYSFLMQLDKGCKSADGLASDFTFKKLMISNIISYLNLFSIFVRHLNCERDEQFLSIMEQFIKNTVGNGYNISLKNLFFRKKSFDKNDASQNH